MEWPTAPYPLEDVAVVETFAATVLVVPTGASMGAVLVEELAVSASGAVADGIIAGAITGRSCVVWVVATSFSGALRSVAISKTPPPIRMATIAIRMINDRFITMDVSFVW